VNSASKPSRSACCETIQPYPHASVVHYGREEYVLAYISGNTSYDGKFRRIAVKVKDKNLKVATKEGYWQPRRAVSPVPLQTSQANRSIGKFLAHFPLACPGLPCELAAMFSSRD
jgi:hypothetical protein